MDLSLIETKSILALLWISDLTCSTTLSCVSGILCPTPLGTGCLLPFLWLPSCQCPSQLPAGSLHLFAGSRVSVLWPCFVQLRCRCRWRWHQEFSGISSASTVSLHGCPWGYLGRVMLPHLLVSVCFPCLLSFSCLAQSDCISVIDKNHGGYKSCLTPHILLTICESSLF